MNLHHTPYNYDSKPTQPRERTDAEQAAWSDRVRQRCDRLAAQEITSPRWHELVIAALDSEFAEVLDACEAVVKWRRDGMRMDERPEAECLGAIMALLNRAEVEYYKYLLDKEGVES